ncbi:hypothetical protein CC78DRAFT_573388 [Lojkania enalia]|uniref:Uncharacterized protein n=1 Tax=Lojkania enalia TaxID=147567 RepID=A0A9P4TS20_9PLEO|nr:hypothetical protein CC78DRAFT_573388 [Didymosphaeria enalia]
MEHSDDPVKFGLELPERVTITVEEVASDGTSQSEPGTESPKPCAGIVADEVHDDPRPGADLEPELAEQSTVATTDLGVDSAASSGGLNYYARRGNHSYSSSRSNPLDSLSSQSLAPFEPLRAPTPDCDLYSLDIPHPRNYDIAKSTSRTREALLEFQGPYFAARAARLNREDHPDLFPPFLTPRKEDPKKPQYTDWVMLMKHKSTQAKLDVAFQQHIEQMNFEEGHHNARLAWKIAEPGVKFRIAQERSRVQWYKDQQAAELERYEQAKKWRQVEEMRNGHILHARQNTPEDNSVTLPDGCGLTWPDAETKVPSKLMGPGEALGLSGARRARSDVQEISVPPANAQHIMIDGPDDLLEFLELEEMTAEVRRAQLAEYAYYEKQAQQKRNHYEKQAQQGWTLDQKGDVNMTEAGDADNEGGRDSEDERERIFERPTWPPSPHGFNSQMEHIESVEERGRPSVPPKLRHEKRKIRFDLPNLTWKKKSPPSRPSAALGFHLGEGPSQFYKEEYMRQYSDDDAIDEAISLSLQDLEEKQQRAPNGEFLAKAWDEEAELRKAIKLSLQDVEMEQEASAGSEKQAPECSSSLRLLDTADEDTANDKEDDPDLKLAMQMSFYPRKKELKGSKRE